MLSPAAALTKTIDSQARRRTSSLSPAPKQKTAKAQQETLKENCIKQQQKPEAKPTILTARAQQNFPPATSLTKTFIRTKKKLRKPSA
jgi:hypothetical protein